MFEKLPFKSMFTREKKSRVEPTFSLPNAIQDPYNVSEFTQYGDDLSGMTVSALLGTGNSQARTRHDIYRAWSMMEKDPIVSIALKTHTIAALGGHESKGDLIFIEADPQASKEEIRLVEELQADLLEIFNKIAFPTVYRGITFGDSYARTYFEKGKGLVRCLIDEIVHPNLIQAYEKGGETIGYVAGTHRNHLARLTTHQLARFKMPRTVWIPQHGIVPKAYRSNIVEDNVENLPILPSMVGGSFLFAAEKPFWDFYTSLNALVGQRWVDAVDESFISVNMSGSTKAQQDAFKKNIVKVMTASKEMADKAMRGEPMFGRTRHIFFTHNEKQFTTHGDPLSSKRQGNISIDDIMLHAKLLSGTLGIDLSMLGFADQLSGGLGEGGFFRSSAQIAESSRLIRVACADFFDDIIDNHMLFKYGKKFERSKRPYAINFYGSISAFENEKQQTRANAVGSAGIIIQTLAQMKEIGMGKDEMVLFMTKQMAMDEEEAKRYAGSLAETAIEREGQNGDF